MNDRINLTEYVDELFSAALRKTGDVHLAEDLTQDTLLAALSYISCGNSIENIRAWLLSVLNRRFYDTLRRKYHQPLVSFGDGFDAVYEEESFAELEKSEEAENVRRAIAYLAKTHRDVIVRHYMFGQSVAEIADELKIPQGTVKSRLHFGKSKLQKGIKDMEKYSKQSYSPVTLSISFSGSPGMNNEPISLVRNDLMAQNILWFAYSKPVSIEEISRAIGIPAAYVEPTVQKLVDGELMKATGGKFYTDFMISTVEDKERYIPQQRQVVHENFELFFGAIENGLNKLKEKSFYKNLGFDEKNSLELYFAFNCLDYGTYMTFCEIFKTEQVFRERPNGGRWIAFAHVNLKSFDPKDHIDLLSHSYSGERCAKFSKFADGSSFEMHVYGADGFPCYPYYHSSDYTFFPENITIDAEITKMLYIVFKGIDPVSVGFNPEYLKAIPWLTKCRIFREEDGKPVVNIPVISMAEFDELCRIMTETKQAMVEDLTELLKEFFKGKKQEIPPHLDSVPLQKQYLYADNAIVFATIREAMKRGQLYDGNYDDDSNGVNQPPCPMVLVIDE